MKMEIEGTLQKFYRSKSPGRDRWDENFAGPVQAALRANITACGRATNTSEKEHVSKTGWIFNSSERSLSVVTCERCLHQLAR